MKELIAERRSQMNAFITCLDNLLSLAKKQEYLTFDDISECAASYGIKTVAVLDDLMDSILIREYLRGKAGFDNE